MHGLTPRHRRKAGSGPPASALIAWIGADPYLHSAVVAAAHRRRESDPPPANSRLTRATVATCFVLACGTVLGVTATDNDETLLPRKSGTSPILSQDDAVAPDQKASSVWPILVASPTPVAMAPMMASPQAPPSIPFLSADGRIDHITPRAPGHPDGHVHSRVTIPPAHSVPPPRSDKPITPYETDNMGKTDNTDTLAGFGKQDSRGGPTVLGKPPHPVQPAHSGDSANSGNPIEPPISSSYQRSTSGRAPLSAAEPTSHLGSISRPGSASHLGSSSSRK